jgi:hypothetical protein
MKVLSEHLGIVDAEKFIALLRRDTFDYTEWHQGLFDGMPLETFLQNARAFQEEDA